MGQLNNRTKSVMFHVSITLWVTSGFELCVPMFGLFFTMSQRVELYKTAIKFMQGGTPPVMFVGISFPTINLTNPTVTLEIQWFPES